MQISHFYPNTKKFSFDFQLFMHRHWTMYTHCLDSDPRWRFTISDFLEIRKSHFEEILSLPTSNLTDAPARSRVIESDIVSFTLWLCWLLNFTEERPIRTQALGYYRESIELSWLPGLYYRVWTPPPRVQVSRWQHVVDKGCNNMEIETQESYHPRRHQNNFAQ